MMMMMKFNVQFCLLTCEALAPICLNSWEMIAETQSYSFRQMSDDVLATFDVVFV